MKKSLLCFCFTLLITYFCIAQPTPQEEHQFFEPQSQLLADTEVQVKRVEAKEFQLTPYGRKKEAGNLELLEFDSLGHLVRQVEIENHDTSRVRSLHYSQPGYLAWEQVEDKILAKSYKTGYRLNPDRSVFQVKNYELLNENAAMLLDTRMYRYDREGKKESIFALTNDHLSESQHFTYDDQGRLIFEVSLDMQNDTMRSISYTYDAMGNRTRVEKKDFWGSKQNDTFTYSYNDQGKLLEVIWLLNGNEKGRLLYEYDGDGLLLERISKTLDGRQRIVKEFNYEFFE